MGRVQFGLIVPEDVVGTSGRRGYLEDVDRLLAAVAGQYDSAWCIDHLPGDVLEGWTTAPRLTTLMCPLVVTGGEISCAALKALPPAQQRKLCRRCPSGCV